MPTITIQPGDTLWSLAKEHLGDGARWRELWAHNKTAIIAGSQKVRGEPVRRIGALSGPDLIHPGTKIEVPGGR